jgi:hypothetical protein
MVQAWRGRCRKTTVVGNGGRRWRSRAAGIGGGGGGVTEVAWLDFGPSALGKKLARWAMGRSNPGVHGSSGPTPLIPFPFIQ